MKNKRVFVSGGSGVIGTALVERLITQGATVFVGDLKPSPFGGHILYRQGDLNYMTPEELAAFNPEIFFHLAATFERSTETPPFFTENFHHNVVLSHHLLSCLKSCSALKRVIFASSYLVYDPAQYLFSTPHSPISLSEESRTKPRNLCGSAKYFHEEELHFFQQFSSVSCACARIFRVFGRGSKDIVSRWIRQALKGEVLTLYQPEGWFDYIYADDAAEGLLQLAQSTYQGAINLGTGRASQVQEILDTLRQHFPHLQTTLETSHLPFEASQADMDRWKATFSWVPQETLASAIPKIVAHEKRSALPAAAPTQGGVLITSLSKKVPLIRAVRQAMQKIGQFTSVYGADSQPHPLAQSFVDQLWHCPHGDKLTPEAVIAYCQAHHLTALIPTRDGELLFYAKHQALFATAGIHVLISPLKTIEVCLDKKAFAEKVPSIKTSLNLEDLEGTYFVVKERFGAGSKALGLKLNRQEALLHAQKLEHPLFQPFIEGIEYSIDAYRDREGEVKGVVVRKRDQIVDGESQMTTTLHHPKLESLCRTLLNELHTYGPSVMQVIESPDGTLHVIECNPRFGGASTASIAVGLDSFYWFFLECCGQSLKGYPFFRVGREVCQIRYPCDQLLWQ